MAWDQRIRLYNSHVSANAELLSVHSDEDAAVGSAAGTDQLEVERRRCEAAAHAVAEAAAGCLVSATDSNNNILSRVSVPQPNATICILALRLRLV